MSGYSTKQISALTGAAQSYFRQNAYRIKGAEKDGLEWRFPLDGLAEFILLDEKLLRQFKTRLIDSSFPKKYYPSGELLKKRIDKLMAEELEKPIEILTTKDICSLPMGDFFHYSRQVSELCKKKKIFAFKRNPSRFAPWHIPTESFAMYLLFNVDEFNAFMNMNLNWLPYWRERDKDMYKIANSIKHYLDKSPSMFDEMYTAQELSDIFDLPINEIFSTFFTKNSWQMIRAKMSLVSKEAKVSWRSVCDYLQLRPDKVSYLYDKMKKCSEKEDGRKILHLLMMYEYYIQNC